MAETSQFTPEDLQCMDENFEESKVTEIQNAFTKALADGVINEDEFMTLDETFKLDVNQCVVGIKLQDIVGNPGDIDIIIGKLEEKGQHELAQNIRQRIDSGNTSGGILVDY